MMHMKQTSSTANQELGAYAGAVMSLDKNVKQGKMKQTV